MKNSLLYIFSLGIISFVRSQTDIPKHQYSKMLWAGYYNQITLNEKWGINSDIQFRTKNWYEHPSQALIRTGVVYKANQKINLTLGIAHFRFFLDDTKTRGEWRPWQEVAYTDNIGKFQLTQRVRIEERYNQKVVGSIPVSDYIFNWRFRYRLDLQYPLFKGEKKALWLVLGNEVMVNAGPPIVYNYFDQNRSYIGINYEHNKNFTYQIQSMHIWQQLSNGITMDNISVIRFNIIHKIKL